MQPNVSRGDSMAVLKRVVRYMLHSYRLAFVLVILCILISAIATVAGATFPQTLVDDYIVPMMNAGSTDFSGLGQALLLLVVLLLLGIAASYGYNRIMVTISQGTMRRLRNDLFRRMESLPIKYFDTHAHGDIMSVYTNDVDTLRQLMSQSIPQIINSTITMAATLVTMILLNPALTVISLLTAAVMLVVTSNFSKLSGRFYAQANSVWETNRASATAVASLRCSVDGDVLSNPMFGRINASTDFTYLFQGVRKIVGIV